jgi:transcriptional regulator with XRE-family HTH domain
MRHARQQAGLTQQQIADAVDRSKQNVSNFENDRTTPSVEVLIAFAEHTGASLDWLLLGREPAGTYDKRIRELPEALREYVMATLVLAERVQLSTPSEFLRPPKADQLAEFTRYLDRLSREMAGK